MAKLEIYNQFKISNYIIIKKLKMWLEIIKVYSSYLKSGLKVIENEFENMKLEPA